MPARPTPPSRRARGAQLTDFANLPDDAHLRVQQVALLCASSVPTIWRRTGKDGFPAAVKLGPGITGWRVGDIRAWLAARRADTAAA